MSKPNMVTESGREDLSVADRLALIEQDRLYLQQNWRKHCTTEMGAHSIGQLINWSSHPARDLAAGKEVTSDTLSKWECELMAWRRGGENEWKTSRMRYYRVKRAKMEDEAAVEMLERGAVNERRSTPEDGDLAGWWLDGVYLGISARDALYELKGSK